MAKASILEREKKRQILIVKHIKTRIALKNEIKKANTYSSKLEIYKKLEALPRNSSPSRSRNRCWATGRGRGYYRDFGLARHALRAMAHNGLIPGLKKSSW